MTAGEIITAVFSGLALLIVTVSTAWNKVMEKRARIENERRALEIMTKIGQSNTATVEAIQKEGTKTASAVAKAVGMAKMAMGQGGPDHAIPTP